MKTIGLLGGMSWESTASYYSYLNKEVRTLLGGLHSAKICLYSVNFDDIEKLQRQGNWQQAGKQLAKAAKNVEQGGADFLVICTNTMHKVVNEIEQAIKIPILHIADATANLLLDDNIKKVGLLGTKFTMQQDFYKGRLSDKFGIEVVIPTDSEQDIVHNVIYQELCLGVIKNSSKQQYIEIINNLYRQGAQAIILGCTEIALLLQQADTSIPLYDTTEIHAKEAVRLALDN